MSAKRKTSNKPYDKDLFCFVLGIFFLGGGGQYQYLVITILRMTPNLSNMMSD